MVKLGLSRLNSNIMSEKIRIHTEGTPNPNALKFVLDRVILESGSANFPDKQSSGNSPLAQKLFQLSSVIEVFFGKDFITISKTPDSSWDSIYDSLLKVINNHFESGEPIILKSEAATFKGSNEIEQKIHEILDSQIRPAVASDGGDVIFDSYEEGVLKLHLQGSCSHCPSSIMTLKVGIESMLKKAIPEIKEVISV